MPRLLVKRKVVSMQMNAMRIVRLSSGITLNIICKRVSKRLNPSGMRIVNTR